MRLFATVTAGLLGNILMTVLTFWYTNRTVPVRFYWDMEYIGTLLRDSLPY